MEIHELLYDECVEIFFLIKAYFNEKLIEIVFERHLLKGH